MIEDQIMNASVSTACPAGESERGRVGEIESEEIDEGSCLGPPPPVLGSELYS